MPEQAAYFLMALIALLVILAIFFGYNSYGSLVGNLTQTRTIFTVVSANGEADMQQIGESYEYTLRISPDIQANPEPKEDMNVISVVRFKGRHTRATEFSLPRGEKRIQPQIEATIKSAYPPLRDGSPGINTFIEGQEYVIRTDSGGVFTVGMTEIKQKYSIFDPLKLPECAATFMAECKDLIQYANDLLVCEEGFDHKCSRKLELCGGSVTITLKGPPTRVCETADVDIAAEGGEDWQASETVTISFFEKSDCTELIKNAGSLLSSCPGNLLGSYKANFNYA